MKRKLLIPLALLLAMVPAAVLAELVQDVPQATPSPTPMLGFILEDADEDEDVVPMPDVTPTATPIARPTEIPDPVQITTEDGSFPELEADGFMPDGQEFVYENSKEGVWRYCSPTLKIEITRCQTKAPKMVWYECEVFTNVEEGEAFHMVPYNASKPMTGSSYPYKVARVNHTVFAVNTDYAQSRLAQKLKHPGIIIRNGKIYSDSTFAAHANRMPNLDVLAMYPDGDMEVYLSDEHTAQEYLDMGVESTLAFGPILVKDGVEDELALTKYGKAKNPRAAIGMVSRGHYWVMMVEGRSNVSSGASIKQLTGLMSAKGVSLAFNLDGGGTACLVFMGKQITRVRNETAGHVSARPTNDLVSVGVSSLVYQSK